MAEARVSVQPAQKPQGGRPEGGISAASREIGVSEPVEGFRMKSFKVILLRLRFSATACGRFKAAWQNG